MKKIILFLFVFALSFCVYSHCVYSQSKDTVATASGLKYIVLKKGKGKMSQQGKMAEVHYTGWLTNGKKFDSSKDRNETFEFELGGGRIIKGWNEGVALMRIGDKFRFIIPPDLAYGEKEMGELIPPNSTLIFDVELIGVHNAKKSILDTLMTIAMEENVKKAIDTYYSLKENYEDEYNFKESQLNILGYQLLQAGNTKAAIEIFKLNVEEFPESFNVYDSLGEGYMMNGDTKLAIKNYKISLKINPKNDNAVKMLEQLEKK